MAKKAPSKTLVHRRKPTFKPRKYQRLCINHWKQKPAVGFLLDPGLGKTSTVFQTLYELREHEMFDSAVVVSTLRGAHEVWGEGENNERDKWKFPFTVCTMHGTKKADTLESDADIRVINWDGLDWLAKNWNNVKHKPEVLVIDESTKGKNHGARRSKALLFLRQFFKRVVILTGTPTPKSMMDLWAQVYYLDQGRALGRYVTQFRNKYFRPGLSIPTPKAIKAGMLARGIPESRIPKRIITEWELREGAEEEIYEAVSHMIIRFSDKMLGLKGHEVVPMYFDLPDDAMDRYLGIEEESVEAQDEGRIRVSNAGGRTVRQRQVANGGLYVDNAGEVVSRGIRRKADVIHNVKDEMVADLVEELQGKPLLVGFEFTHDRDRLLAKFGHDTPYVDGSVSVKEGSALFAAFNRGEFPIMLAQISAVAHSVNLQEICHHVCFYSMTYNLEDYIQFIKRVDRSGQKNLVMVYLLIARDTVDEDMLESLTIKDTNQRSIMARFEKNSRSRLRRMVVVKGKRKLLKNRKVA